MRKTAARLAREALEELGVRHTFGIPGVHNTELYDELGASSIDHAGPGRARGRRRLHGGRGQPHGRRRRSAG